MKRLVVVFAFAAFAAISVGMLSSQRTHAQGPGGAAAYAKQAEFEKTQPKMQIKEEILSLVIPGHTIGETEGVSMNSKGHLFVYSRTGKGGISKGGTAAELFEFDQNLKYVKLWGEDNYGASFAHNVNVDKYDNVWMVDEGSNVIVKFDPNANVKMVLGRKTEAIDYLESFLERGEKQEVRHPVGNPYTFNRETGVTWDSKDNIYVSDGYNNARLCKFTKDGTWVGAVGTYGPGPDQFNTPHCITSDAKDNIYVGDRGNFRVQVYNTDLKFEKSITGMGAPWGICVTPGPTQYLISGDGNGKLYKFDMSGKLLGWAQSSLGQGQAGCLVHQLHCASSNVVYKGACSLWNIEKITLQ